MSMSSSRGVPDMRKKQQQQHWWSPLILFLAVAAFPTPSDCWLDAAEVSALRDIRASLDDLPGSSFFKTWDFSKDPCSSFAGVVCWTIGGSSHIAMLSLGSGIAGTPGLKGTLPGAISRLSYLRSLAMSPGQVRGSIPASLGSLRELQFLGISKNKLSGTIPAQLSGLCSLQALDLSYNSLSGSLPQEIGRLPSLTTLTLSHNSLTGTIPGFTAPIFHLDLQRNCFTGGVPQLPSTIEYLSLATNSLTGPIASIASLSRLGFLDLSFNHLSGSIPGQLFGFKMTDLRLQRNQLSGQIQPSVSATSIAFIDLSYNQLTGSPPSSLATSRRLLLNNNRLSGAVPQEYVDAMAFGDLQLLYLQHNYVTNLDMSQSLPLPPSCTFCIQYNCMATPPQSSCPASVGRQSSRPLSQCSSFHRRRRR